MKSVPSTYESLLKLCNYKGISIGMSIKPKINNEMVRVQLINVIGILFMKGVFYYGMFVEYYGEFRGEVGKMQKVLGEIY